MATATLPIATTLPPARPAASPGGGDGLFRMSLDQYHRMIDAGVLIEGDPIELLEGILVQKMPKSSPHRIATAHTRDVLAAVLPAGWHIQSQDPITLDDSEPEPDLAVIRGAARDYRNGHAGPADVALVVEVADSSLDRDRGWKRRIYARNAIPVYWIVNLTDRVLEVYADPSGLAPAPDYATARHLTPADRVDVVIAGTAVGTVPVADLLP